MFNLSFLYLSSSSRCYQSLSPLYMSHSFLETLDRMIRQCSRYTNLTYRCQAIQAAYLYCMHSHPVIATSKDSRTPPPCLAMNHSAHFILHPLLLIIVVHIIVRQPVRLPSQPACHLGESFRLDEVIEWEWREHCSIPVNICFHEQCSAAYTIEVDFESGVAFWVCAMR
jgi:hypothetical protein